MEEKREEERGRRAAGEEGGERRGGEVSMESERGSGQNRIHPLDSVLTRLLVYLAYFAHDKLIAI